MFEFFFRKIKSIAPDGSNFSPARPTTVDEIEKVEAKFGFRLPELLRELYLTIGNGGFGPGYGVMGIPGGFTDDQGSNILSLYLSFKESDPDDPAWIWPKGLIPICHFGCTIYSCVHCLEKGMPVYSIDVGIKEIGEPMQAIIKKEFNTFEDWVNSWKK